MAEYDIDKAPQTAPQHHLHSASELLPIPPLGVYPPDVVETAQATNGHTGLYHYDCQTLALDWTLTYF